MGRRLSPSLRHVDLTLDQYAGIGQKIITATIQKPGKSDDSLKYNVAVKSDDQPRIARSVQYETQTITALDDYDASAFKGRLETFLGSCYNSTKYMGQLAIKGSIDGLWLPNNSAQDLASQRAIIATSPCDAQFHSSVRSL